MTTLADRIADFETQANQLLDLPQQIANTAQSRINQIGNYWDQRVQSMRLTAHVHQLAGDDNAAGTEAEPLKSVDEALRRTPPGGVCEVRLHADYHFSDVLPVDETELVLTSATSVRWALTFERLQLTWSGVTYRTLAGVRLRRRAAVRAHRLTIQIPALDASWAGMAEKSIFCGFAQLGTAELLGGSLVGITYCDINIPADPFCALIGNGTDGRPLELYLQSCVAVDQPLEGRLLSSATDTNGTATSGLPWLQTNLTHV